MEQMWKIGFEFIVYEYFENNFTQMFGKVFIKIFKTSK